MRHADFAPRGQRSELQDETKEGWRNMIQTLVIWHDLSEGNMAPMERPTCFLGTWVA